MDDKELIKKFSSKDFLKKNDFAAIVAQGLGIIKENKGLVVAGLVVMLVLLLGLPTLKWIRAQKIDQFNAAFYAAETSVQKEKLYQELVNNYKSLPASQLARIKLFDTYIENQKEDQALQIGKDGLSGAEADIFKTVLLLKTVGVLKKQNKIADAVSEIETNQDKVIKPFLSQLKLIKGDLLLLDKKRDDARKVFESLASFAGASVEQNVAVEEFDPETANAAKDKLLLMDLGVL